MKANPIKHIWKSIQTVEARVRARRVLHALGFEKHTKLLLVHADDIGLTSPQNEASYQAMRLGLVNSGSIMVPCPGFEEAINMFRDFPEADLGIHLTLTCEWPSYKWSTVEDAASVPSLVDSNGHMWSSKQELLANAKLEDIRKEFDAQVQKAIDMGMHPTHLDSHMYTAYSNTDIMKVYLNIASKYRLPALFTPNMPMGKSKSNQFSVNYLYCADGSLTTPELPSYYQSTLENLEPGLNCLLIHVAFDNPEMRAITGEMDVFGSAWRQTDYTFFTSDSCRELLEKQAIRLITWREINDRLSNHRVHLGSGGK